MISLLFLDASSDDGNAPVSKSAAVAGTTTKTYTAPSVPTYSRKRFDDEDVEEDVKDDWDAEDEEPEKPDVSNLVPIKKKSTVKQKIKEREERERQKAELGQESDEEEEEEDPAERRRREREAQIKADVENAANLLGTSKITNSTSIDTLVKPTKLSTKEEWEEFSDNLYKNLIKKHSTKPGYDKHFIPHFTKLLAENLRDVDCRKQSIAWKSIADGKTKAEKEKKSGTSAKSGKAAKPKTVGTSSAKNTIDMRAYGDEALDDGDDLDFM